MNNRWKKTYQGPERWPNSRANEGKPNWWRNNGKSRQECKTQPCTFAWFAAKNSKERTRWRGTKLIQSCISLTWRDTSWVYDRFYYIWKINKYESAALNGNRIFGHWTLKNISRTGYILVFTHGSKLSNSLLSALLRNIQFLVVFLSFVLF